MTKEWRWVVGVALIILLLSSLPYLLAWQLTPSDMHFSGLLSNPRDGNSYLAKMRQGMEGQWQFHLPYTSEDHPGAYIFLFYLFLGHLARLVERISPLDSISALLVVYHGARLMGGMLLLLVAYAFTGIGINEMRWRRVAFLLVGLSSGLGWLVAPLGYLTIDMWVPEANTFYSLFANPHFPLAEALMLSILGGVYNHASQAGQGQRLLTRDLLRYPLTALLLAVVQPLAVLTVGAVLVVYGGLCWLQARQFPRRLAVDIAAVGGAAAPVVLYDLYVYRSNPALRAWSAQNVTPSPPPWDYALGYGLVLLLAIVGMVWAVQRRNEGGMFLTTWAVVNAVLLYVPFALQRRLVMGLHVPLCVLAAMGLRVLLRWATPKRQAILLKLCLALTMPTTLFLMGISLVGALRPEPLLYLGRDEVDALHWLETYTSNADTVLAAPETGMFIPAWSGNRVVYGHPFETINAVEKEALVRAFFDPATPSRLRWSILGRYGVRYVFYGPRERTLGGSRIGEWGLPMGTVAYRNTGVVIWRVEAQIANCRLQITNCKPKDR